MTCSVGHSSTPSSWKNLLLASGYRALSVAPPFRPSSLSDPGVPCLVSAPWAQSGDLSFTPGCSHTCANTPPLSLRTPPTSLQSPGASCPAAGTSLLRRAPGGLRSSQQGPQLVLASPPLAPLPAFRPGEASTVPLTHAPRAGVRKPSPTSCSPAGTLPSLSSTLISSGLDHSETPKLVSAPSLCPPHLAARFLLIHTL